MRRRENKWPGTLMEEIDQLAGAAGVAAEDSDRFAQCSDLNVDASVTIQVIDCSAAVSAKDAGGVSIVDHCDAVIFFGEVAERRQVGHITVHRENAVSDEQFFPAPVFRLFQDAPAIRNVLVFENFDGGF